MQIAIATMALLLLLGPPAFAVTDEQIYKNPWAKYATAFSEKPKLGCVCLDGGLRNRQLGAVRRIGSDQAACYIPGFTSEGVLTVESLCNGSFVPLAK